MKYPALKHLKTVYSDALMFALEQVITFSKSALAAIKEVEAAKADKAEWVGVTISASGWVSDTSVPEKPYRYDISVSDVTTADSADVNISDSAQEAAAKCGLSARTSTAAGKIQLRAKTKPSADMAAEYRIWKGV